MRMLDDQDEIHPLFHGAPKTTEFRKLRKRIIRDTRGAIERYGMIERGARWRPDRRVLRGKTRGGDLAAAKCYPPFPMFIVRPALHWVPTWVAAQTKNRWEDTS